MTFTAEHINEGFNSYTAASKRAEGAVDSTIADNVINLALESLKKGPGRFYVTAGEVTERASETAIQKAQEQGGASGKFISDVKDAAFRMATGAGVSNDSRLQTPEPDLFAQATAFGDQRPTFMGALISDAKSVEQANAEPIAIPLQDRADFYATMLDPEANKKPASVVDRGLDTLNLTLRSLIGFERREQAIEKQLAAAPQGRFLTA